MSRYLDFSANLTAGSLARAETMNNDFSDFNSALNSVETDVNTTLRLSGGAANGATPDQSDFQIADTATQRAGRVIGFDSSGAPITLAQAFNWRGTWTTGTAYKPNDVVYVTKTSISLCTKQNTAGSSFSGDSANWTTMIDLTAMYQYIRQFKIITADDSPYTAAGGDDLMVDVSSGAVTITLPSAPSISDQPICIVHVAGDLSSDAITIGRNGQNIMSLAEDMTVDTTNASLELAFANATLGWRLVKGT